MKYSSTVASLILVIGVIGHGCVGVIAGAVGGIPSQVTEATEEMAVTEQQANQFLDAHNYLRGQVSPAASNMEKMVSVIDTNEVRILMSFVFLACQYMKIPTGLSCIPACMQQISEPKQLLRRITTNFILKKVKLCLCGRRVIVLHRILIFVWKPGERNVFRQAQVLNQSPASPKIFVPAWQKSNNVCLMGNYTLDNYSRSRAL